MRVGYFVLGVVLVALLNNVELASAGFNWTILVHPDNTTLVEPFWFLNITAAEVSKIPSEGCGGLSVQQMSAIPAPSYAGFRTYSGTDHMPQIPYIPYDSLTNLTAAQLGYITPVSASFFLRYQIFNIPSKAASGFTANQLERLPADYAGDFFACLGFTPQHMANIPVTSIRGFRYPCTANFDSMALSEVSINQLQQFSTTTYAGNTAIAGFRPDVIQNIPLAVFSGWTNAQIAIFSRDICGAISSQQFATLSPASVGAFRSGCVESLTSFALADVTSSQLSAFTVDAVKSFSAKTFMNIPSSEFSGWTQAQVASFSSSVCAVISAEQLANITLSSIGSISANCARQFQSSALSGVSGIQLSEFTLEAVQNFSPEVFQGIPAAAFSGWSVHQISSFPPQACGLLAPEQVSQITILSFGGFTPQCFANLNNAALVVVTAQQFVSLSLDVLAGFTHQISFFSPEVFAGLNETAAGALSSCPFTPDGVKFVSVAAFQYFSVECIASIPTSSWGSVSIEQIQTLSLPACNTLSGEAVSEIQDGVLVSISLSQLGSFNPSAVSRITGDRVFLLYAKYGLDFVNLYTEDAFVDFPLLEMVRFKSHLSSSFSPSLPAPDSWSQVTWIQFAILASATFSPIFWSQIPLTTIGGIRADQVRTLFQPADFKLVEDSQGSYFAPDTLAAMSVGQLSNLRPGVFWFIPSFSINALSLASWQSLSVLQISNLPNTTLEALNCTLVIGTSFTQVRGFKQTQQEIFYLKLDECKASSSAYAGTSTTGAVLSIATQVSTGSGALGFIIGAVVIALAYV